MRACVRTTLCRWLGGAAAVLAAVPVPSPAADFVWNPSVALGDFDDPNSWFATATAPTGGDTVTFEDPARANFTIDGAVHSATVSQGVGFVFQSDSGVRTLTVDDVFLEDSSSLLLNEVRLALSGSIIGTGAEDTKLELLNQARVTGGVIDGVLVLMSDASARLEGVTLQNSIISRTEDLASSILDDVSVGQGVILSGSSGSTLRMTGVTTLVDASDLTISSNLTLELLGGSLVGAGTIHQIDNRGSIDVTSATALTFDPTPGVAQALTIDNQSGVINLPAMSSLAVDGGGFTINGGLVTGGGTLSVSGGGLVIGDATTLSGVTVELSQSAPLSFGAGVTLQGADIRLAAQTDLMLENGFVVDAASTITTGNQTNLLPGESLVNDGLLSIFGGTLSFPLDATLTGTGQATFSGSGSIGIAGGGSLTLGADQTLVFDSSSGSSVFGTGFGGTTLVNNGQVRYAEGAFASVVQADNSTTGATAQDFTLVNNAELRVDDNATMFLGSDGTTGLSATIDNRSGVISLGSGAQVLIQQSSDIQNVLRGGEIVGTGDGSGEILLSSFSLRLTDTPTLNNATIRADFGELSIDGDLVNNGLVRVLGNRMRFERDTTLSGDGEVLIDGLFGGPNLQFEGGHTVTVGADQTLSFRGSTIGGDRNLLFGTGAGGITIVNNGLTRVENGGAATVFQANETFIGGAEVNATAQDFTLVNNGELLLEQDATLGVQGDFVPGITTTIDNRAGLITVGTGARIYFSQYELAPTFLRGGLIMGLGDGSGGISVRETSLTLSDNPTLANATIGFELGGQLTIDGDLINEGLVDMTGDLLRFTGATTLSGSGEVRVADSYVQVEGGQPLTVGANQSLTFSGGSLGSRGLLFGVGAGGITIVNNGLTRVAPDGTATVWQANETSLSPNSFDTSAQDFTLINNGELSIEQNAELAFISDPTPGIATTIDNRAGTITLAPGASVSLRQYENVTTTLRGGQIVGTGDGSGRLLVTNGGITLKRSLLLTDAATLTNAAIVAEEGGGIAVEGAFHNNGAVRFVGGQLDAATGEWLGVGQVTFEEDQNNLASRIESLAAGATRFGGGQQVRFINGVTTLAGATIAGSLQSGAGSLDIESSGTLRVESVPAAIDDVSLSVSGLLDVRADLAASIPIPVAAGGELRIEGAVVTAPSVSIGTGGQVTLAGGVLDTPVFELNGAAVGNGTIVTPNDPATPTQISAPITGTSLSLPIALTGWIEGDGLLDNVLIEGTHSPGDGIAFIDAGSLAYGPDADLRIEITNQNVLNPGFDRLALTGAVTLGGDLDLQLVDYVENTLSINDQLVLLTSSGLSGQFSNVAPGDRVLFDGGLASAQVDYGPTSPFDPNHVVFSEFVREPQQVFWVGGTSNWNSPLSWDLLRVPNNDGPLEFHAIINAGTVDVDVPVTLTRLTLGTGGVSLTLNQPMTVGDLSWNGGNLAGPNVLTITGESTIDTDVQVDTGPGLVNQGTATWVDGNVVGQFLGQGFVNEGDFLIELTENHSFWYVTNTANGVIRHTGTARATLGPNTGFENDGLVEITGGGALRVGRDRNNGSDGDFLITNGVLESEVGFSVDHKFNGSVSGQEFRSLAGTISFNGAYDVDTTSIASSVVTFNTPSPATTDTLTIDSGDLNVETMLVVDQLNWNGGGFVTSAGETVLETSAVVDTPAHKTLSGRFVNQGQVTWRDGNFSQSSQGLFQNEGTLLIELTAERSLYHAFNTSTGVVRHTSAARAILGPTVGFENDGLVEITGGGTLRVARDRNNGSDGDFLITNGVLESAVGFAADHKFNGSVTGQEFRSVTGAVSFNGAYDVNATAVNGGVVAFNTPSPATTGTLSISAGEVHVVTEFVFDQIAWTGGGFGNSAGSPILTGQGAISGPTAKAVATTLVNRGELTWNDGPVGTGSVTAARLRNESLLTIDLVVPRSMVRLENAVGGVVQQTGAAATIDRLSNGGTLDVAASTLTVSQTLFNHSGTTLAGGEWVVRDGATLDIGARTITVNEATVRLFGPGSTLAAIDPLADNRGVFEIAEGRDFTTAGDLSNSGSLVIGAGSTLTVSGVYAQTGAGSSLQVDGEFVSPSGPATFAGGAALGGSGFIPGDLVIGADGIVSPGASPGTLTTERLVLEDGAVYEWEFDGTEADSILTNESLSLPSAATLRVVQLGGAPSLTDEFVLFEYASDQVDPANPTWVIDGTAAPDWDVTAAAVSIDTVANRVLLTGVTTLFNAADFNNDGVVDAADYTVWRDTLDLQVTPFTSADGDGDGHVTELDYVVWRDNYGVVGVSPATNAVPEPGSVALASVLALSWLIVPLGVGRSRRPATQHAGSAVCPN